MPLLSLFRHAKAAPPPQGQQAFDRPLTERGRNDAGAMGKVLAELGIDLAVVSSARRTRETWEIAARSFGREPPASIEPDLYLCRPDRLVDRIRAIPDTCAAAVLIGHNPCWHEVALWLAGPGRNSQSAAMRMKFPTAALAVFTISGGWSELDPRHARLERFVTPARPE